MAKHAEMPGTAVTEGTADETARKQPAPGRLDVSEILADRAAAPSPFGDDQTFPLPVEHLTYTPTTIP